MAFLDLFYKIGYMPIKNIRKSEICVVLNHEYLKTLLQKKQCSYTIPLSMKTGTGEQKMWFVREPERKTKAPREQKMKHERS